MKRSITMFVLALIVSLATAQNAVKAGDKISGTVKSEIEELEFEIEGDGVPNENNPRVQVNLSDDEQDLVTSVNDIGFNLFRKVGVNKSILLSPLGMTYALGLINNGAAGKTRKQINQVLSCDDNGADKINNFCRKMLTEASKLDKLAKMEITNEFIQPKSVTPKSAFMKVAKDSYDTQFKESESDQLTFTLVNTINFKGIWTDKFLKDYTEDEVFKGEDGKETTVDSTIPRTTSVSRSACPIVMVPIR